MTFEKNSDFPPKYHVIKEYDILIYFCSEQNFIFNLHFAMQKAKYINF